MDQDYERGNGQLVACDICDRNFSHDALSRHRPICQKSSQKKRKTFDSSKQRAEGTELVQFRRKNGPPRKRPEPAVNKKNNWRAKHTDFINTIRAARGVQIAMERGEPLPPPPPPTINPDYIQCDHCGRRFSESAAERHIAFCKEQQERLPTKKKPDPNAYQKQAARLQYQPPKLKKTGGPGYQQQPQMDYNDGGGGGGGGYNTGIRSSGLSSTKVANNPPGRQRGGVSFQSADRTGKNMTDYSRPDRPPSGQVLRTGRTAQTYSEARQLSANQRTGMATRKYPSSDNIHGTAYSGSQYTGTGYAPGGRGHMGGGSSGYGMQQSRTGYGNPVSTPRGRGSSSSSSHSASRPSPGAGRFCYDCGAKFPAPQAKFCCECGAKKSINA